MIKEFFSVKRIGAALMALTLMSGVGMAHSGHKPKRGKKRASIHKHMVGMKHMKHMKGMKHSH